MNSTGADGTDGVDTPLELLFAQINGLDTVKSRTAAMEATLLARVPATATPDGVRGSEAMMHETSAFAELGIVLHQSDQTIRNRVNNAYDLVNNYPATHQALFDGNISPSHARVIQLAGDGLDDDARAIYEERALECALQETPGRLKSLLASIAEQLRSKDINARHREARKHRGVWVEDVADGMSELTATLPSHIARGIMSRLTKIARDMKYGGPHSRPQTLFSASGASGAGQGAAFGLSPDGAANTSSSDATTGAADTGVQTMHDSRTLDQLRADVFSDLLLSGETCAHGDGFDAVHGELQIIIPVTTLTGENDLGADLAGTGPIDAEPHADSPATPTPCGPACSPTRSVGRSSRPTVTSPPQRCGGSSGCVMSTADSPDACKNHPSQTSTTASPGLTAG